MAQEHERMQATDAFLVGVDKGFDRGGRNAHRLGRNAGQGRLHGSPPDCRMPMRRMILHTKGCSQHSPGAVRGLTIGSFMY